MGSGSLGGHGGRGVSASPAEKVTSEQTLEGSEGGSSLGWEAQNGQRAQPVQQSWGTTAPAVLEGQRGGPCGGSSEEGTGQVPWHHGGAGADLGFSTRELGVLRARAGGGGPDLCSWAPSGGESLGRAGEQDHLGEELVVRTEEIGGSGVCGGVGLAPDSRCSTRRDSPLSSRLCLSSSFSQPPCRAFKIPAAFRGPACSARSPGRASQPAGRREQRFSC